MNNHGMEALATAFALLHGNPPKSLRYRRGLFCVTDQDAADYRHRAFIFVREHMPYATNTTRRAVIIRNKLLRALYAQLGREPTR